MIFPPPSKIKIHWNCYSDRNQAIFYPTQMINFINIESNKNKNNLLRDNSDQLTLISSFFIEATGSRAKKFCENFLLFVIFAFGFNHLTALLPWGLKSWWLLAFEMKEKMSHDDFEIRECLQLVYYDANFLWVFCELVCFCFSIRYQKSF